MNTGKKTAIILILLYGLVNLHCQQPGAGTVRLYETWISVNNESGEYRGILYQVKDSSIVIGSSKVRNDYLSGNVMLTDIPADEIDFVKTRRLNIVKAGGIAGSVAGLAFAVTMSIVLEMSGAGGLGVLAFLYTGPAFMAAGALIGMVSTAANQHKTIINRDFADYELYRDKLKRHSYIDWNVNRDNLNVYNPFKEYSSKKVFVSMSGGPSFPAGSFPSEYLDIPVKGNTQTGLYTLLSAGYMLSNNFSISLSNIVNEYTFGEDLQEVNWGNGGFMANANYSFQSGKNSIINFKIGAGPIWSYLADDNEPDREGSGAGINTGISWSYVLSGSWSLFAETGYFMAYQRFEGNNYGMKAAMLSGGIEYRFRKKMR